MKYLMQIYIYIILKIGAVVPETARSDNDKAESNKKKLLCCKDRIHSYAFNEGCLYKITNRHFKFTYYKYSE